MNQDAVGFQPFQFFPAIGSDPANFAVIRQPQNAAGPVAKDGDEFNAPFRIMMEYGGSLREGADFETQFLPNFPANRLERCFAADDFAAGEFK